jgi:hypothetical protein
MEQEARTAWTCRLGVLWSDDGGELFSPILPIVEPAEGGDELCSVAPPEVSALPDCGIVAVDASGGTVFAVGGLMVMLPRLWR